MKEELEKLQDEFAYIDMISRKSNSKYMEILLKELLPLQFRMEPDHHGAPHIHINYGKRKHVASYRVNDGVRVAGDLSNKYDKIVKAWISKNQILLLQIWRELKDGNQAQYEMLIPQLL